MEDITDIDHRHAKRVFKNFNNKNMGDYHDLYLQSYTLWPADVFENFRNNCIKLCELDTTHFLSAPGLVWQVCFKKNRCRIRIIDKYWHVINGWKRNKRKNMSCNIYRHATASNKYMKNYD